MGNKGSSEARGRRSSSHNVLRIIGGAAAVLAAVVVLTSLHDIRRYWNMTRM
jgi:hypothetical protein